MCLALLGLAGAGAAGGSAAAGAAAAGTAAAGGASIGNIATLIGAGLGAIGSIAQGNAASAVGEYNAQVAQNNATAERQRAAYEAGMTRDRVRRVMGAQKAAFASSGLDIQSGTPLAVFGDTAKQGELDVLARLYGGEAAATAYQNDAARMRAEGKAQQKAGYIGAASSLIGGIADIKRGPSPYRPLAYGGGYSF